MSEKHYDVFLSYSGQDLPWVSEFASALKTDGVKAWFDADIAPGDNLQEKLQEALRESGTLVIVFSRNNLKSPWMFFELGAALADKKRIIPILPDDMEITRVPKALWQLQSLRKNSPQEAGKRVAQVIKQDHDRQKLRHVG
uniref:ADP-ribosyl cyclase/cyclic ADP-ribose hydrolase n=1 Tax=Candidatus Kentrum sp. MB TaxID=2138164 RepID=A0A451BAX2_9GAMM|nr:MAG: TIR domain-containing protein [Candidatus Kentron sp. MB]VFK31243.1 MAG: TIR domain-containing protein [Candidatus Kentron sp. MB]VFK75414.1 MAG: TIR domain-containing protein [Candidatus Kentron sp. MB]